MPYAVASAGNSCDGREEGVGHPDGKDSVLLPDGLSSSNVVARRAPYPAPYGELRPAADERDEGYAEERGYGYVAVDDRACGDGDGHGECYGP